MSEIKTNLTVSGESSEYRGNISISVVTLNSNLVDTQSSFRTNIEVSLNIENDTISSIKTDLELNNVSLDFYLVDMTKLKQSILYFSKFFNMNFEPELIWEMLAQGTSEQINASHLSDALSKYVSVDSLTNIYNSITNLGNTINGHINNNIVHLTDEEKYFLNSIMTNPPWSTGTAGLFEYINAGDNNNVIWAVRPLLNAGKDVGIISNTFISCRGVDIAAGGSGGGITRQDLFYILKGEPQDSSEYINSKYLRLDDILDDYATEEWVNNTFIKEEKDPTVPSHVKKITQDQIYSWDLVASLFSVSEDDTYVLVNDNRGFVSTSFLSCKGLDASAANSGSGIDMSLVWYYLGLDGNEQINKSHITTALNDYATEDWVSSNYVLGSTYTNQIQTINTNISKKADKTLTITAGNGLTGGGTLEANRTFTLGTPSTITATTTNEVTSESHTHEIDQASTSVAGIVKLYDALDSDSIILALTAKQGKAIGTRVVALEDMWENKDTYLLAKNNRGIVSNSFISCRGLDETAPQVSGTFDRGSLFDILSGEPQNGESINLGYLDLSTYATIDFVTSQGYITSRALTGYAKQSWVEDKGYAVADDVAKTYATITALSALQASHDELRTDFDALDELLNSDTSGVIDTWHEVVAFLDGYSESQDLASILSAMNTDIASRAKQAALDALAVRVSTNEDNIATQATAIGNLTKSVTDNSNNISALDKAIKAIQDWFELKTVNGTTVLYTKYNLASELAIAWGGMGDMGGGGSGLIERVYGYNSLGGTFDNNVLTDTFNAYTINRIASRVTALESKATNVSISNLLSQGTLIGRLAIDNTSYNIYAPTIPTKVSAFTNDAKYLTSITSAMVTDALGYTPVKSIPTTLPNPYALTFGNKSYNGSSAKTITAGDLGALTAHQAIYALTIKDSAGAAQVTYTPNSAAASLTLAKSMVGLGNVDNTADNAKYVKGVIDYGDTNYTIKIGLHGAGLKASNANYLAAYGVDANGEYFIKDINKTEAKSWLGLRSLAYRDSLAFSELTDKPTTISGYGITDAYTSATVDSKLSGYLPLSGGRMTGQIIMEGAFVLGVDSGTFYLGSPYYPVALRSNGTTKLNGYDIIHSGNIYSQIVAKADSAQLLNSITPVNANHKFWYFSGQPAIGTNTGNAFAGSSNAWNLYSFPTAGTGYNDTVANIQNLRLSWSSDYFQDIFASPNMRGLWYRNVLSGTANLWSRIVLEDTATQTDIWAISISKNAASATKLQTARTLWGQSFDGTGNVSGDITGNYFGIMDKASNSYIRLTENDKSAYLQISNGFIQIGPTSAMSLSVAQNGNVLINTMSDIGYKLQVSGAIYSSSNIIAGGSVTWGSASDRRLKDCIQQITDVATLDVLTRLNPVSFAWNATAKAKDAALTGYSVGFIADEFENIIKNSGRDIYNGYRAIDYKLVAPYLVRGWQNHESRIERLERENKELKAEINRLKANNYGNC